jgi:flagellar assembly factor FliW
LVKEKIKNMPTLSIQGTELQYEEKDIITFEEGLIGLPHLRRMVVVKQSTIEPFLWLASLDEEGVAFVVAEAHALFPNYEPSLPADSTFREVLPADERPVILAIVLIASEWQKTTVNLRAPLFISASAMRGAQIVLTDNKYSVGEPLPLTMAA